MDKQQSELVAPPPPLLALEIGGEREKEAHLNEIANIYEEGDEGKEEYEQFLLESHKIPEKYSLSKLGLEQAIDSMVRPYIKTRPLNPKNPITDFHAPRSPRTPELDNKHDSIENCRLKAAQNHGPKVAAVKRHENKSPRKLERLLAAMVKQVMARYEVATTAAPPVLAEGEPARHTPRQQLGRLESLQPPASHAG